MKKAFLVALGLALLAALGFGTARAVGGSNIPSGHVGICHHTGASTAHEWVFISPDADGVLDGHGRVGHQFDEDIIPAFTVVHHGQTIQFPGLNLDERLGANLEPDPAGPYTGAEILANHCQAPTTATTTTPTTGTTTTPTSPPTVTTVTTITVTTPSATTTIKENVPSPPKRTAKPPMRAKAPFTR